MIVKILGVLDILAALFLWLFHFFHIIPEEIILILAFYLLAKGVVFLISKDIASMLDVLCAVLIFINLQSALPSFIIILISVFLLQKGILSLLA